MLSRITDIGWPPIDTGRPSLNLLLWAVSAVAGVASPILVGAWQLSPLAGLLITTVWILTLALIVFGGVVLWAAIRHRFHPAKDIRGRTFRDAFEHTRSGRQSSWDYFSGLYASWKEQHGGDLPATLRDITNVAQTPTLSKRAHIGRWVRTYSNKCDSAGRTILAFGATIYPDSAEKPTDLHADVLREEQAKFWDDWVIRAKRNGGYAFLEVLKAAQANSQLVRLIALLEVLNDQRLQKRGSGKTGLYGLADRLSRMK